jgi:hypothetical protein
MKKQIDIPKNLMMGISLIILIGILFGCATDKALDAEVEETRSITTIMISEHAEAVNVFVKGNQNLEYTAIRQTAPRGLLIDFPDTGLKNLKPVYTPPENELISSIELVEMFEDQTKKAQIFIALNADTAYDLTPVDEGIEITFQKTAPMSSIAKKPNSETELAEIPAASRFEAVTATRLESVTATSLENKLIVNVKADGTIKDYKSFTLDGPPRIVIDFFNLQSPYENEQKIAVDSKWVDRVRHCVHADKVRVVLDTHQGYLSEIETYPTNNGILIYVRDNE